MYEKEGGTAVEQNVTPESIIKRYDRLKSDRVNWDQMWEELATYLMPGKIDFISTTTRGTKRAAEVYDSTAIHALQILSASLHGSLTSPSTKWFGLRFREDELNENKDAKDWLEKCSKGIFQEFGKSNFSTEVAEAYQDLAGFGTSCLQFDVKTKDAQFDGFNFRACHLAEVVISESEEGRIDTVFRKLKLTARQAHQKFGDDCGEKSMKALKTDPDKEFEYIQAVIPRELKGEPAMVAPPNMRPYACYYVSVIDKKICKESGYYELPYMVPRWGKTTGDVYGFGPGCVARPDIKTLNESRKLAMKAWEKSIDPPLMAMQNGILGKIDMRPSSVTYVRDMNGLAPISNQTNWSADQLMLGDVRGSVRRIFFSDQLELNEGPQMTATEVQVRYELMQRLLGPTLGRLQSEFLNPIVERAFYSMLRGNALPQMPQVLQDAGGDLDIEYVGPLARSQKMDEVTSIQRAVDGIMQLAQVNPEVLDIVDVDKAGRTISDRLGAPADILRGDEQVADMRQSRQQQQQQQAEMDMGQQQLEGATQAANLENMVNGPV
jgi:hypothetical protein|tara:strand:- start:451 stop:2100 length:1650 start_codon:yes stop_codon:yes gene_type:complete